MCILFSGCTKTASPRTENIIGTLCSVNAFEEGTESLYNEIFTRLDEIDFLFNLNRTDSVINQVNISAGKYPVAVAEDFIYVLNKALSYAEQTDGMFDPTIGPLVKLWGINTEHAKIPSDEEIKNTLQFVNWKNVIVENNSAAKTVFLKTNGMSLDLGGIAKGYAADEISTILSRNKVKRAIIDLGGNVYVFGKKKDGSDWNVGIKNPFNAEGEPALVLTLSGENSVVTSGIYERFFEKDGIKYHHIIDTKTGKPAVRNWSSVTVVTASSIDADALSTIGFLVGFDKFAEATETPAIFINNDGRINASACLKGKLHLYNRQNNLFNISFR